MKKTTRWVRFFRPAPLKTRAQIIYKKIAVFSQGRPLTAFFILLAILFVTIAAGNILSKLKPKEEELPKEAKKVNVYEIGTAPKITLNAQIEKAGVVKIVAQSPGIVQKINIKAGQEVQRGQNLISLSTNYQGGNTASLTRQLAQRQYQHNADTFDLQKDLIGKQREVAEKTDVNTDELREITQKSVGDTSSLISLNDQILTSIDTTLKNLQSSNVGEANDQIILQTQQAKSQFLAANNQVKTTQRQAEFAAGGENAPAELSDLAKSIALKQLDLQEKTLTLARETSLIQLRLAQVNESLMFPSSPFNATVQRIHVNFGDSVTPGTILVTLSGSDMSLWAVAKVPGHIARNISKLEPTVLKIDGHSHEAIPYFISTEATDGTLYSVLYSIPQNMEGVLTDQAFLEIQIPIGYKDTSRLNPFIPFDAVHQTQDAAIVFVIENETAVAKKVELGTVQGNYVQVNLGLTQNDKVITNRNIVSGDKVSKN